MSSLHPVSVPKHETRRSLSRALLLLFPLLLLAFSQNIARSQSQTVLYESLFETSEGFDPRLTLIGQGGWVGYGSGGNGIVTNFFDGLGQQAFVGFDYPAGGTDDFLNVWRPINYAPPAANPPLLKLAVYIQINPSTNGSADDFRWSAYSTNGTRLFTIDFETASRAISYALDDPPTFVSTGRAFEFGGIYDLTVWMDFRRNLWSARLDNTVIVNSQPITKTSSELNLGDFDAVWAIRDLSAPGNNYMVFDEYLIGTVALDSIPPILELLGINAAGAFVLRVHGEQELNYAIEASTDLVQWQTIQTIKAPVGGSFDYEDKDALRTPYRVYRVRQVP